MHVHTVTVMLGEKAWFFRPDQMSPAASVRDAATIIGAAAWRAIGTLQIGERVACFGPGHDTAIGVCGQTDTRNHGGFGQVLWVRCRTIGDGSARIAD